MRVDPENTLTMDALRDRLRSVIAEFDGVSPVAVADATGLVLQEAFHSSTRGSATAQAILRGHAEREILKQEQGGNISADKARVFLGLSKPALLDRYKRGRVLAWREKNAIRFPVWQFAAEGGLLPGIEEALLTLDQKPWYDDWAKVLFFLNPRQSLGGKSPLDLLREGRSKEVVTLAEGDD